MEMSQTPPKFDLTYNVTPMNIGASYAEGITQAGKSLSDATKGVFDVMTRSQNADDMLKAMLQNKMLSPEAYNAVAGKSLGAKEGMLGMYGNQWIAQQAQERALQQVGYKGTVDAWVQHQQFLDAFNATRGKYPIQPGGTVNLGKVPPPNQPNQGQPNQPNQPNQPPTAPQVQPVQQPLPGQVAYGGSSSSWAGPATITIGKPVAKGTLAPDAQGNPPKFYTIQGKLHIKDPNDPSGRTFLPLQ